jgi:polar amino acid transport system permease protein
MPSPETWAALREFLEAALYVARGSVWTALLIAGAMLLGLAIGVPLASAQIYGPAWLRALSGLYVWFFRGVPILVLLFLLYYGVFNAVSGLLSYLFGINASLSPFCASILALGLASGAYQSQIFRGAILSLPSGQYRAAQALGFSRTKAATSVILPQALRLSIPAWSNEYSILLKDSAVAYVLGTLEIMARTKQMASRTYQHILFYLLAGFLYFLLTYAGVRALKALERKIRVPGLGHEPGPEKSL